MGTTLLDVLPALQSMSCGWMKIAFIGSSTDVLIILIYHVTMKPLCGSILECDELSVIECDAYTVIVRP